MFQIHEREGDFLEIAIVSCGRLHWVCIYIYMLHSLQDLLQIFPRNLDRKATCSWLSRISFCEEEVVGLAPWVLMDAPLQYRARALAKHVPRFDSKHLPLFDQGAGASSGSRFRALRLEKGSNWASDSSTSPSSSNPVAPPVPTPADPPALPEAISKLLPAPPRHPAPLGDICCLGAAPASTDGETLKSSVFVEIKRYTKPYTSNWKYLVELIEPIIWGKTGMLYMPICHMSHMSG